MDDRRYYLGEPYVLQIVALDQIAALLQPLANIRESPLPVRMRNQLARMHAQVRQRSRALRRGPAAVQHERAQEEPRPPVGD